MCRLARVHSHQTLSQTVFFAPTAFTFAAKFVETIFRHFTAELDGQALLYMLAQAFQIRLLMSLFV